MKKIPPFKLEAIPLNDEAAAMPSFKWAPDEVGTRHQLGGDPNFLQAEIVPSCPGCNDRMTFYAQLDSINDDVCIADCGMLYVFVCLECNTASVFIQSY